MPPSQLKRLKASLREQGITGPQKGKKQKKQQRQGDKDEQRAKREAALQGIRESFNPFEFKALARPKKFDVTTSKPAAKVLGRPGVSKSHGEETRRKMLLPEMNKRHKVGGIVDRRIGENDPTMTPDERMLARYARETQKKKGASLFDLEEADDEEGLTHGGRALEFDDQAEDYDAASIEGSSDEDDAGLRPLKRRRESLDGIETAENADEPEQPERKKSKAEVMKEVIAKSKMHKYERQAAKEDDEELREELDKDLPNVLAALRGHLNRPPPPPVEAAIKEAAPNNFGINPDRAALLEGKSRQNADKEYDARVRQMMYDQRSKPTERTKTDEEKAKEEADRLKELEDKRMKRMKGEAVSDDEDEAQPAKNNEDEDEEMEDESIADDAAEFGLSAPSALHQGSRPEGVEDEDDFIVDDDLIASGPEDDADFSDSDDENVPDDTMNIDEDDEFLKDVLPAKATKDSTKTLVIGKEDIAKSSKLAYTYPCPRSHSELLEIVEPIPFTDVPTIVQRIRALYHSGLHHENKAKLADFSLALVDHISYMMSQQPPAPLAVVETLIRHIHSLARTYPQEISNAFRSHLKNLHASNDPTPGDLTILTAIGSIYPTSDHFHQVVTPAITLMARWLGLSTPQSQKDIATGAYIGALCLKYQQLAKRYIPELVRYAHLALKSPHNTPDLINAHIKNLLNMADLWSTKSAFHEIFAPETLKVLKQLKKQTPAIQRLQILLNQAKLKRRPLTLHNHRPLPIKSNLPKFEEAFNPDKHYDPDKDRAEANRLRKEYKRERKGALRELRKDANFIAREKLKEKKERDRAYEQKYKRLVAEIQGEEGHEKNEYEREKRARKRRG